MRDEATCQKSFSFASSFIIFLFFCLLAGKHFNCQIVLVYCCNSFVDGQVCLSVSVFISVVVSVSVVAPCWSSVFGPSLLSLVFKVIFADVVAFYGVCRCRCSCSCRWRWRLAQAKQNNQHGSLFSLFACCYFFSFFLLLFSACVDVCVCKSSWPSALLEVDVRGLLCSHRCEFYAQVDCEVF